MNDDNDEEYKWDDKEFELDNYDNQYDLDNQDYDPKARKDSGSNYNLSTSSSSVGPLGNNQISRKNYCFGQ